MSVQYERMSLDVLCETCQRESSKFFREEVTDDRFCYELFRRALKHKNEYAWECLWRTYRNLVSGWIRASGGAELNTPTEELITLSFEKFWHVFSASSAMFDDFPSLPALLQYLRLCCASIVTDRLRRRKQERLLTDIDTVYHLASTDKPDRALLSQEERTRFWKHVLTLLNDETEVLLMRTFFIQGLRPRQIQQNHPDIFPTVQDVYRVKRNIMNRLKRDDDLRNFGLY